MSVCVRCLKPLTSARSSMCDDCRTAAGLPPLTAVRGTGAAPPTPGLPKSFLEISDAPLPELPSTDPESAPHTATDVPALPILNASSPGDAETDWSGRACVLCGKLQRGPGDNCPNCENNGRQLISDTPRLRAYALITDAKEWACGRAWIWRAVVLIYLVWVGYCHLVDSTTWDLTSWLTFCINELGRLITNWAPVGVSQAVGCVVQLLAPLYLISHFIRQRDYFAVAVAGSWLSFSVFMLDADSEIAQFVRWLVAALVLIASLAWGAWLCFVMIRNRGPVKPQVFR